MYKGRTVGQVLADLERISGHSWKVEATGGGCEVFYSETLDAVVHIDAGINYSFNALTMVGLVFDTAADCFNHDYRREIAAGLEDPAVVDPDGDLWHFMLAGPGVDIWSMDHVTLSNASLAALTDAIATHLGMVNLV
jgi:hypothetical protein